MIEKNLRDYKNGKITLWQTVENCNLSLWEMIEIIKERSISVPYNIEDLEEDIEGLNG